MNRVLHVALTLALGILTAGCAGDALLPSAEEDVLGELTSFAADLSPEMHPTFLTAPSAGTPSLNAASKPDRAATSGRNQYTPNAFAGPLFGLATAPNGDILIADAGAGILTLGDPSSIALPGVSDMSPLGRRSLWALKGLTGPPGANTGQGLYRASNGKNRLIADLFAFENDNNPDAPFGGVVDSNPFDVHSLGGQAALVADAGGNTLLRVDNQGQIDVLAIFPPELVSTDNVKGLVGCPSGPPQICDLPDEIPGQAVPTSIAVGPDGYYYVGELKGFPAPTNASNIWRVAPNASQAVCGSSPDCVKVFDGGFTSIIDLATSSDGTLYVLEFDEQSWFAIEALGGGAGGTVNACDVGAGTCTEVATGIPVPTAITFGKDGTLWATQNALDPGAATVVTIP